MVPDILMSTAAVIASIAVLVMAVRGFKRLEASVGSVKVTAEAVNRAVNNVAPHEPTLRHLVLSVSTQLEHHVRDTHQRLNRIEDYITQPGRQQ